MSEPVDNTTQPSLYEAIKAAGIETYHHESDLYFPVTPESREILSRYPLPQKNATVFTDNVTKKPWYDVPFNYDPFWEQVSKRSKGVEQ